MKWSVVLLVFFVGSVLISPARAEDYVYVLVGEKSRVMLADGFCDVKFDRSTHHRRCVQVLSIDGSERIKARQDADRQMLVDLLRRADERIAELERQVAELMAKNPAQ